MALSERFQRALGVIAASRVLSDGDKRVWEKQVYLDSNGQGSVMSAGMLGQLLGKEPETIEACRRRLIRAGILQRSEGRGRKTRWFVRFPESWAPTIAARLTAEQYAAAAAEVDKVMLSSLSAERDAGHRKSRSPHPDSEQADGWTIPGPSTGFQHVSSQASVRGEGGKGGQAPQLLPSERNSLPALEIPGGGESLIEKEGGWETAADRGDWRAVLRPGLVSKVASR